MTHSYRSDANAQSNVIQLTFVQPLILFIGWLLLWRISIVLEYAPHASIWFPPAGLTLAAFWVLGLRAVVPIGAAAVVATFWIDGLYQLETPAPDVLYTGLLFAAAHITPYAFGAWFLRRSEQNQRLQGSLIMVFLLVAALASLLVSYLGTYAMTAEQMLEQETLWQSWLPWWIGDMAGIVVLTPLFVSILEAWLLPAQERRLNIRLSWHALAQPRWLAKLAILLLGLALCITLIVQTNRLEAAFTIFFLVLPVMWITYTEVPVITAICLAVFSTVLALTMALFDLMDYALVAQFAVTISASTAWFGLAIPVLNEVNTNLSEKVAKDGLTHVFSREHFLTQATVARGTAARAGKPTSLVLFDLDNFKAINDEWGHLAGDQALIQVTQLVADNLRDEDLLGRFGGDEFMLLLPKCSLDLAVETAERLRRCIGETFLKGTTHEFSASFGVVQVDPNEHILAAMDRADKALLDAKRRGRNQVFYER